MKLVRAVIVTLILSVPVVGWVVHDKLSHPMTAAGARPPAVPEFSPTEPALPAPAVSFTDGAGRAAQLADFRGRVILVNLWATWCQPCVREMPALDRLQAALGSKDFTVVLVSQDRGGAHVVDPFFGKLGLSALSTYLDPKGALGQAFGVRGLPTSILIDRDGNELGRVEGAEEWDGPPAKALLDWYIARGQKQDEPAKAASGEYLAQKARAAS